MRGNENEPLEGFDRKYCPVMRSVNEIGDKCEHIIMKLRNELNEQNK